MERIAAFENVFIFLWLAPPPCDVRVARDLIPLRRFLGGRGVGGNHPRHL